MRRWRHQSSITSKRALDDLEVRDVAQEVRRTRCIWISLLTVRMGVGCAVGSMTVHAVGLDGRLMASAVREINWDHLGRIVGGSVTVGVRAHFEEGFWESEGEEAGGGQAAKADCML